MKIKKVLFCSRERGPWIDPHESILRKYFQVQRVELTNSYLKKLQSWLKDIGRCDLVYLWFASYIAIPVILAAKLFGKKIVIVAAGFDVAKSLEISHGTYSKNWLHKIIRTWLLHQADLILSVSEFNRQEAIQNAHLPPEKCVRVYLAISPPPKNFIPLEWSQRKAQVVMMTAPQINSYQLKGIDYFLAVASRLPDVSFVLMGGLHPDAQETIQSKNLRNLTCLGYIPHHSPDFLKTLNESKIALQLSVYESFGGAIIDAGHCGCELIVTSVGALPEVTADQGHVIPLKDPTALEQKIKEILAKDQSETLLRSQILKDRFSLERCEKDLLAALHRLN